MHQRHPVVFLVPRMFSSGVTTNTIFSPTSPLSLDLQVLSQHAAKTTTARKHLYTSMRD